MHKKLDYYQIIKLFAVLLGSMAISGAVVYRLYSFNWPGILITIILSIAIFLPFLKLTLANGQAGKTQTEEKNFYIFAGAYIVLFAAALYILANHTTAKGIVSPWQVVPEYFFAIYGLATLSLILALSRQAREGMKILLISAHYFLSFSIAVIIYKIGYGYDPFVHEATLKLIDSAGAVEPKPFYYLGEYSLIIVAHKLLFVPIEWLNKILTPVLASILLPAFIYRSFSSVFGESQKTFFLPVLLLILPFSVFILNTPQGLAYLFLIIVILLGLKHDANRSSLPFLYIISLSALSMHPIAGIPAIIFSFILTVFSSDMRFKKTFYALSFLSVALALPAAFYVLDGGAFAWSSGNLAVLKPAIPWKEGFVQNFIYFYGLNMEWVILILIFAGRVAFLKYREDFKIFILYAGMTLSLFISYLITKNFAFSYLINYERNDFPDRIMFTAILFSLPFIVMTLYKLTNRILRQDRFFIGAIVIFSVMIITANFYLSYPRFDKYFNSRGYSTGENDIKAVLSIKEKAGQDYIVLANQQVSAAALREFGFDKYYKGDIFYYPVPTSGPLYQYYLDMVYEKPTRETMDKAMDLAGVNEGYFVLNKYWWAFPKVLDEAKMRADSWWDIGNGDVYIFKYSK